MLSEVMLTALEIRSTRVSSTSMLKLQYQPAANGGNSGVINHFEEDYSLNGSVGIEGIVGGASSCAFAGRPE